MKNIFSKNTFLSVSFILTAILIFSRAAWSAQAPQDYFNIKVYNISSKAQEQKVDAYLKNVYIPALHRAGITQVGVFKPVAEDTIWAGKVIFVFMPLRSVDQYLQLPIVLNNDKVFLEASKGFVDAPYDNPPYTRLENILLRAFINMPKFRAPSYTTKPSERIYELRSYESATEGKAIKKIEMFNQGGEVALFEKLGFNAAFYGEVLIGSHMPNLMYMTTFENKESREAHWAKFKEHPDWKVLQGMEEYKFTVSKNTTILTHPTDYSDF
jgi:hypothetical protein